MRMFCIIACMAFCCLEVQGQQAQGAQQNAGAGNGGAQQGNGGQQQPEDVEFEEVK